MYEARANIDSWRAIGDTPCVVHIKVVGAVEYLDADGAVIEVVDTTTQRGAYEAWCGQHGVEPLAAILGKGSPRT